MFGLWMLDFVTFDLTIGLLVKSREFYQLEMSRIPRFGKQHVNCMLNQFFKVGHLKKIEAFSLT